MEDGNILTNGIEVLYEIKENLIELQGNQNRYNNLMLEEERLEREVQSAKKAIADEIASVSKKRREEISDTFDTQLSKNRARMKKTQEKRDKRKNLKISERIDVETASLLEENRNLKSDIKTEFKKKHVPNLCNTGAFYALYSPNGIEDFLFIICSIVLTLLVIPSAIYFIFVPVENIWLLILIYFITVMVFGGLYILGSRIKYRYIEDIRYVKKLRIQIRKNNKQIKMIKRNILKDRDESNYGLEGFDQELALLEAEYQETLEQKKDALLVFDNTTSHIIASEIKNNHQEMFEELDKEYQVTCEQTKRLEANIKAITLKLASDYEPFLGKNFMTIDKLDELINIMLAGTASTVSEAIAFYKQQIG